MTPDRVPVAANDPAYVERLRTALAHSNRPGPYCEGGTLICDICVGSCGVEEHDELVENVLHERGVSP